MYVKSTILVGLMIASLASARGITSRVEEDEERDLGTMESDVESAADPVIALTPECTLAANGQTDPILGSTDQTRSDNDRSNSDKADDNKRTNMGRRTNIDKIRNGIMRASSHPTNSIWQLLDNFEGFRQSDTRDRLSSIISSLMDPLIPPQMQYVDNTLRLVAIKNSIDEVLAKIFPNLHMIQHPTESNSN